MYIFTRKEYGQCIMAAITETHISTLSFPTSLILPTPKGGVFSNYTPTSTRPTDERLPTVDAPVKSTEITPKKIDIDFNRPLREHLDRAAVRRGWEAYKVAFKRIISSRREC